MELLSEEVEAYAESVGVAGSEDCGDGELREPWRDSWRRRCCHSALLRLTRRRIAYVAVVGETMIV